jgi:tetratricopeptide (TPR) repeat protein
MQYDQAVNLLNLCINQEAFETAAVFFQKLVMITPQDFHARLLLEQAEQKRRQPIEEGKTAMTLEIMAKLDVKYRHIFNFDVKEVANKANVNAIGLIKEVLLVDAASFLKRFIELYDLSPTLHYNLAQICNSLNIVGEALRHGTRAIELQKDSRDARTLWEICVSRSGTCRDRSAIMRTPRGSILMIRWPITISDAPILSWGI